MVLQPSEDLFEDTRMTFGEHLEELRKTLVKALIGLGIGVAIGLFFADEIVKYLQRPLDQAIRAFLKSQAEEQLALANNGIVPPELQPLLDEDGLLPRKLKVDSRELAMVLEDAYPDLPAITERNPHAFRPSQLPLERVPQAASLLVTPADNAAQRWLSEQLTDEEREQLRGIAKQSSASSDDRLVVLAVLDRLAQLDSLYVEPAFEDAFAGVKNDSYLPGWLQKLITRFAGEARPNPLLKMKEDLQTEDDPAARRRLQRLLISRSLSPEIGAVRTEVVDLQVWETTKLNPQALKVEEVFMVWLKAALISGIVISSPWIFYQTWLFIAAGLYPHERRYVHVYLPLSVILFLSGVLLAFFGVFQPVLMFLFQFNASMGIDPQPR
ncbi:MAG: twin-arginine translocase subunit TatC, partial [Pirellulaceae bacterium]